MKIYYYSRDTFEFTKESDARRDPKDKDNFLIPAFATSKNPPKLQRGKAVVFKDNDWILEDKIEGIFYNKETKEEVRVFIIGKLPSWLTIIKPESDYSIWDDKDNKWISDEKRKSEIIERIKKIYDEKTKEKIMIFMATLDQSITQEMFFNSIKLFSVNNHDDKEKLSKKSMKQLIDLYIKL